MVESLSERIIAKKKNPKVVIIGQKDILSYVSIFSVLQSGGTYIPLSSNFPLKRILQIISIISADIIISQNELIPSIKKNFQKKYIFHKKI